MTTKQLIEKLQSLPNGLMDCEVVFMDKYDNIHSISRNVDTLGFYAETDCVCDCSVFLKEM